MSTQQLIRWWEQDAERLARDRREVLAAFPNFVLDLERGDGVWMGALPVWPFPRPKPAGVDALCEGRGLEVELVYSAAHPAVAPTVLPIFPAPTPWQHSLHDWHVLPAGGLCLMQSPGHWRSTDSIVDLLLKGAGWRIEYALMERELIEHMSLGGIVTDPRHDDLIARVGAQ
jgi:hypothetical protein